MMSVPMKKVDDWAKEEDDRLKATDFHWGHYVMVEHEEGSQFIFNYAFAKEREEFWVVFSEHQGYHIFAKDEVVIRSLIQEWIRDERG